MNTKQGLAYNGEVRFFIIDSTSLINELNTINQTSPVAIAALGRSVSITALMGLMLKGNDKLSTTVSGDGQIGKIIAVANGQGEVKATLSNPYVDIPLKENGKLDVSAAVGNGYLQIVKDQGLKDPFVGQTELISGEIAEDYAYYFSQSEQVPTAISAGVLVDTDYSIKSAGALIVQLLPAATEETIERLEWVFANLKPMTSLLQEHDLDAILSAVFEDDFETLKETEVKMVCDCSYQKFEDGIKMLAPADLLDVKKDQYAEVICNFCRKEYKIETRNL